jgi:antitoxin MazE
MKTHVAKWGNSLAVRIPRHVAAAARFRVGDDLEVEAEGPGKIKLRKQKQRIRLEQLVSKINSENRHHETDWGDPIGNEKW